MGKEPKYYKIVKDGETIGVVMSPTTISADYCRISKKEYLNIVYGKFAEPKKS